MGDRGREQNLPQPDADEVFLILGQQAMQERRTTAWITNDEERLSNLDVSIGGEKDFIKAKTSPGEHLQDSVTEIEEEQNKQTLGRQSR